MLGTYKVQPIGRAIRLAMPTSDLLVEKTLKDNGIIVSVSHIDMGDHGGLKGIDVYLDSDYEYMGGQAGVLNLEPITVPDPSAEREFILERCFENDPTPEQEEAIDLYLKAGAFFEWNDYFVFQITPNVDLIVYYPDSEKDDAEGRWHPVSVSEPAQPSLRGNEGYDEICLCATTVAEIPALVDLLRLTFAKG